MSKRGCHGNVKCHEQTVDTSKFPRRMYEQLLKASVSQRKSPFRNSKKTLWEVASIPPLLVRPRVKSIARKNKETCCQNNLQRTQSCFLDVSQFNFATRETYTTHTYTTAFHRFIGSLLSIRPLIK